MRIFAKGLPNPKIIPEKTTERHPSFFLKENFLIKYGFREFPVSFLQKSPKNLRKNISL